MAPSLRGREQDTAPVTGVDRSKADFEAAEEQFSKGLAKLEEAYESAVVAAIKNPARAAILLLDRFTDDYPVVAYDSSDPDWFHIVPYQTQVKILRQKQLEGDEARDLGRLMATAIEKPLEPGSGLGAGCHYPLYAVRFDFGDSPFFATSLCWECSNYFFSYPYPVDSAVWRRLSSDELLAGLQSAMPVTDEERKQLAESKARKDELQKKKVKK